MIVSKPRMISRPRCVLGTICRRSIFDLAKVRTAWSNRIQISEEVQHALEKREPIVALESAIITHGMPYPTNLSTTNSLQKILRSRSVTPATIALIDGTIHVGVSDDELQRLANPQIDAGCKVKVSRRDLAPALSLGLYGGTTVSGTMYIAHTVGIDLFVTGGIGGVHRGAERTFDISADLLELGRTPVGIICAGAKSILDIPRTLEVLETNGVCVSTFGKTKDFPAFYSPKSGSQSPWNVDNPSSAAMLIHCGLTLPQPLSTLLAVPIPSEHAEAGEAVQKLVEQAITESLDHGVKGNEVTPWLLKRVGELSQGDTLRLNIALIENNARVGSEIALELNKLKRTNEEHGSASLGHHSILHFPNTGRIPNTGQRRQYSTAQALPPPRVMVIGAAALDMTSSATTSIAPGSTTPGKNLLSPGGVARNIAESAQRLLPPNSVQLVSSIGTRGGQPDPVGIILLHEMRAAGLRTDGVQLFEGRESASCSLVLNEERDLVAGVADMDIATMAKPNWDAWTGLDSKPDMVVFDCNLPVQTIRDILVRCEELEIPTLCDPTSTHKALKLREAILSSGTSKRRFSLTHIAPNLIECEALFGAFFGSNMLDKTVEGKENTLLSNRNGLSTNDPAAMDDVLEFCSSAHEQLLQRSLAWQWLDEIWLFKMAALLLLFDSVWVKAGHRGLIHLQKHAVRPESDTRHVFVQSSGTAYVSLSLYDPPKVHESDIISTTGAGDTLVGALVAGLVAGRDEADYVRVAVEAAGRTLKSLRAVG